MHFLSVITLLVVTSQLARGFDDLNINHLLLKLDPSQFNLSIVQERWIEQPLDHFNVDERRNLKMKYYENLGLWRRNGPVYIFVGGNKEANPRWIATYTGNLIGQLARETNGAMFATEHRYYGESYPHIPYDKEYYKFLSSQQALADLVTFIKMLKSDHRYMESKVVVVGGFYAGNLAAWLREKHPDLVDAVVASSAPVLAKKNFHEYFDVVSETIEKYGTPNCISNVARIYQRYERLLQSTYGIEVLKRELNICSRSDLTLLENQQYLMHLLYRSLMVILMRAEIPYDIQQICNRLQYVQELKIDHSTLFQNTPSDFQTVGCVDVDFCRVKVTGAWMYQLCNEFGYFPITTQESPFGNWNPLKFYLKFCKHLVYGDLEDIEKRVDAGTACTNEMYGGNNPVVSKVVFTKGDMDPWSALGALEGLGDDAPVTVVNGTSHCAVLAVHPYEPIELTENREYVKDLIKEWISTP